MSKDARKQDHIADGGKEAPRLDYPVVGLGASAGGLAALENFFDSLPGNTGAAYVVIQHLDPHYSSHMAGILSKKTSMAVSEAREGAQPEPDHVYTIPSDSYLRMENSQLHLDKDIEETGKRMPVDIFLRSLAQDQKSNAIGIILSGSGTDGSLGIREIRGTGGMTMAQHPDTADYNGMPQSAIDTGVVDYVLPPDELAEAVAAYIRRSPSPDAKSPEAEKHSGNAVETVLNIVAARINRDFRPYKRSTVRRRIERRMGISGTDDLWNYVQNLREDPEEVQELARDLLVCVTSFFREPEAFEALHEKAIKQLVQNTADGDSMRIWCPACATGEEVYSLIILLQEEFKAQDKNCRLKVFGSDVESSVLDVARGGVYPESISTDVSAERLERYFEEGESVYRVKKAVREPVLFAEHDLLRDPPFSNMDLISCRNLLIYLQPEAQKKVLGLLAFALNRGGYLFLGKSDNLSQAGNFFDTVDSSAHIFRRSETPCRTALEFPTDRKRGLPIPEAPKEPDTAADEASLRKLNQWIMLQHFDAACVLVRPDGDVVHFFGPTDRYLRHRTGVATLNLVDMTEESMGANLGRILNRVRGNDDSVELRNVSLRRGDSQMDVDVTVYPLPDRQLEERLIAVIFEPSEHPRPTTEESEQAAPEEEADKDLVAELRTELEDTRRDYQATVQQLETSNEELRAANEEVTSMNEELQSTNEELQSSKEELQSMNEELNTLNDQLEATVRDLRRANSDLQNLFRAIEVPTIFLDKELRVKRIAPTAREVFNLKSSDEGRPLSHITSKLTEVDPAEYARQVLNDLNSVEKEVWSEDGACYLMRVVPYRSSEDKIEGVVMTFTDVTNLKRVQAELEEMNRNLEEKVERRTGRLRRLAVELAETEKRERQRLAEVLHDDLKQLLTVTKMKLDTLAGKIDTDEGLALVKEARDIVQQSIEKSDSLTRGLCPTVLYDEGLRSGLEWLRDWVRQHYGLDTTFSAETDAEPRNEMRKALLFHGAQELLVNAARHSGAKTAHMWFRENADDSFSVVVQDEGTGFSPEDLQLDSEGEREGFGLFNLRERLKVLGGVLDLDSSPGSGAKVTVTLPAEDKELAAGKEAT